MMARPPVWRLLTDRLSIDPRGLAAFRIGLGLALLLDLVLRLGDLDTFYTDAGVMPRQLLFAAYPTLGRMSLHTLSGGAGWQLVLFGLTAVVSVALIIGWYSRVAAVLAFVLVVSLHARNPVILNAGDSLLRRLLLWGVLLPLGARWGLRAKEVLPGQAARVSSVATAGVLVQVLVVYVVNAVVKFQGTAWPSGTAVRYVFGVDALTVGLGDFLAGFPTILTIATYAWLLLLVLSPLLLLTTGRPRLLLVGALGAGHLGMLVTLRLGVFPLVSLVGLTLFVPSSAWDRLETRCAGVIAQFRSFVGVGPRVAVPSGLTALGRPTTQSLATILLAFVLVWTAASVGVISPPIDESSQLDPTQRRWDMFAPTPLQTDGWYVLRGETTSGREVAVFTDLDTTDPPPAIDATYPSHRWYVYLTDLRRASGVALRPGFAHYLCARWNRHHAEDLARVEIVFVAQPVQLRGEAELRPQSLGTYPCPTASRG